MGTTSCSSSTDGSCAAARATRLADDALAEVVQGLAVVGGLAAHGARLVAEDDAQRRAEGMRHPHRDAQGGLRPVGAVVAEDDVAGHQSVTGMTPGVSGGADAIEGLGRLTGALGRSPDAGASRGT